jgi:hypothetical protein
VKSIIRFLIALAAFAGALRAADVDLYAVTKAQSFTQTSAAAPVLLPTGGFAFASIINAHTGTSVTSATLKLPDMMVKTFGPVPGVGSLAVVGTFNTEAALDAAFASGGYQFTINAVTDGTKTPTLNLGASNYPNTPTITNFAAAQDIDWTQDFTLTWGTFVSGGANDSIQLTIRRKNGTQLFATPSFGSPGVLSGTAASVVIPANTFVPGESYTATLYFGKIASVDLSSYLGVPGATAFIKTTEFPMKAPGTTPTITIRVGTAADSFDLTWNADIGRTYDLVRASDLSSPVTTWTRLALVTATSTTETWSDTPGVGVTKRFYRLQEPP